MKFFALFIAVLSAVASANVYKCEDQYGKISYSDTPCIEDSQRKIVRTDTSNKTKKYEGFNQEKYLKLSKEKRDEICALKKKFYKEAQSKKCILVMKNAGQKACEAGEALQRHIQEAKKDYEFSCQI